MHRASTKIGIGVALFFVMFVGATLSFPAILVLTIQHQQKQAFSAMSKQFPVTVNPQKRTIVENDQVNAYFESDSSPLQAAVGNVGDVLANIFTWIALGISNAPWYQSVAAVDGRFVVIDPGMRKEQVASAFAKVLGWNNTQKQEFLTATPYASLPLSEGSFSPGIYSVAMNTTPLMAQSMVNERFGEDVLSHYATTTAQVVSLDQALTVASLIEREAGGPDDMRLISGIIWNRLFINMNLQIDATLQYAKANSVANGNWWPTPTPADRFRKSLYNTYQHPGLPPTPIANPSVAAILAALNPRDTSCLFYFHDAAGQFHCSDTYAEHVALLKKYFGRGK